MHKLNTDSQKKNMGKRGHEILSSSLNESATITSSKCRKIIGTCAETKDEIKPDKKKKKEKKEVGNENKCWPILWHEDSTGRRRIWKIRVEGATIITSTGLQDGKKIDTSKIIVGKNIGKSNETTPEEQAIMEAAAKWIKQRKKGYAEIDNENINKDNKNNEKKTKPTDKNDVDVATRNIYPMLACKWNGIPKTKKRKTPLKKTKTTTITTPTAATSTPIEYYGQPKLDGVRCLVYINSETGKLEKKSRNNIDILTMSHMDPEWLMLLKQLGPGAVLDGEIYEHGKNFQQIMSLVLKSNGKDRLQHHIYDWIPFTLTSSIAVSSSVSPVINLTKLVSKQVVASIQFKDRIARLQQIFDAYGGALRWIKLVETASIPAIEEAIEIKYADYLEQKYEGMMLRTANSLYEPKKRSKHLSKLKKFEDSEFIIIDAFEATGNQKGCVVWRVQDPADENIVFNVVPKGTFAEKRQWFLDHTKYKDKFLKIRFQGRTEEGIPRIPVCIGFRAELDMPSADEKK